MATTTTTRATTTKKGATTGSTVSTVANDDFFGIDDAILFDDVPVFDDNTGDDATGGDDMSGGTGSSGNTTVTTVATETTTSSVSNEAAKGAAASLPIIPIAAGAGGGIVLLIIIIVLVMRRNRRKDPRDRPVVAFENPMYDNIKGATGAASAPSGAAFVRNDDAQGLYDEPAFKSQTEKDNPMYHSQEDLAAPEGHALTSSNFEDDQGGANEDGGPCCLLSALITLTPFRLPRRLP